MVVCQEPLAKARWREVITNHHVTKHVVLESLKNGLHFSGTHKIIYFESHARKPQYSSNELKQVVSGQEVSDI